ncbi:unnamed protein product, partial [Coregonus sp. 'balchen']
GSHVFPGLRELSLLHTLTYVPVHKCTLGVHQVKLVVKTGPSLCHCSGVAKHAHCPLDLGQISTRYHSWGLVVDTNLETSWAPVYKLDGAFCFDGGNGSVNVFGHNVATVSVGRTLDIEVSTADVIDGLIVYHESTVRMLQCGVGGQDGVVGLNNSCGHLGSWVDGELKLGLLAIVNRQAFHQQGGETRTGATSEAVEDQEALEASALFADPIQNQVYDLFADSVMPTGVVVGCILLSSDQLLRVEELANKELYQCYQNLIVLKLSDLTNDSGLQIHKHSPGDMLASSSLTEEGVKGVVSSSNGLVTGHLSIRLDPMLKTVQLPACIADLDASLAHMDGDTLTLWEKEQSFDAHLLIIFLQGSHVFPGLRELSLLHTLTYIPVHESTLGIHQVKLVVKTGPGLCNSSGVAKHAHCPLNLGQISTRYHSWGLINIEGTIESEGSSDGGHNLANQPVKISVGGTLNIKVPTADVIDGLIVYHESTIRMLQCGVGGQDGVVRLNNSCGHLWSWVDGELKLGLLAIVNRQAFHQQGGETRTGATSKAVEDQEALEASALIHKHSPGDMLASSSLTEEGVEGVVSSSDGLVTGHLTIGLDPVLQTVEFPACIAHLDSSLTHVY